MFKHIFLLLPFGEKAGIAYMDVAFRRPGKGREQERKLEGVSLKSSPSPLPSPRWGEGVVVELRLLPSKNFRPNQQ